MIIEHSFTVQVPTKDLWDYFIHLDEMSACVPGAQNVKAVDAETYEGALRVKVGSISANFGGRAKLLEVSPPSRMVIKADGKDPRIGNMVVAKFTADLHSLTESQTEVAFQIDLSIIGSLGNFGKGVISEIAKRLAGDFGRCVEGHFLAQGTESAQ